MATVNEQRLTNYLAAEQKILLGQSYRMGDREVRRADLAEIRAEIARLQSLVAREKAQAAGGGSGFRQANFG
ncbi:primosomal replication protein PriB/PriC domain protein [Lysobacter olei]